MPAIELGSGERIVGSREILHRLDLIAEGVIGGEHPNAADLQIAPSLRLLATFADVRPLLDGRPGWALAQRLFPEPAGGHLPAGALSL